MATESLEKRVNVQARYKRPKRRYAGNQRVDDATANRTIQRVYALGGSVKGINLSDGVSGREARIARRQKARRRYNRNPATIQPVRSGKPNTGGGVAAPY